MKKIVLTGGGTAGHVYPALALIDYLKGYEIHFIGSSGMEKDILKNFNNVKYHEISAVKLVRKINFSNFLIPFKLIKSIFESKKILKSIKPDVVFSKGGFVSVPVVISSKSLKIPCISHESDLSMGLANKINLKFCQTMCTTFFETSKINKKCKWTGQPIRKEIFNGKPLYSFDNKKPNLLIIGGSLGAKFINEAVQNNLDELLKMFNLIHITGNQEVKSIKKPNYIQIKYAKNIQDVFASCDMAVSRAGAGVICELLALEKPLLLLPLSKKCSRGDQIENATLFKKLGFCEMIEEENFSKTQFFKKLNLLLKNRNNMVKNMKKAEANSACEKIVKIINESILKSN